MYIPNLQKTHPFSTKCTIRYIRSVECTGMVDTKQSGCYNLVIGKDMVLIMEEIL